MDAELLSPTFHLLKVAFFSGFTITVVSQDKALRQCVHIKYGNIGALLYTVSIVELLFSLYHSLFVLLAKFYLSVCCCSHIFFSFLLFLIFKARKMI